MTYDDFEHTVPSCTGTKLHKYGPMKKVKFLHFTHLQPKELYSNVQVYNVYWDWSKGCAKVNQV